MALFEVRHLTTYRYAVPVRLGEHRMMLRPRDSENQRLIKARLDISPTPGRLRWIHDVFDNCVAIAEFHGQTRELHVVNALTVEHVASGGPDVLLDERARTYPFAYDPEETPDLAPAIARRHPDPTGEIDRWVRRFLHVGRPTETGALLMTMTYAIKESFVYERRFAKGTQSPLQTLALGRGTCRDFATLMIEAARALGFAARFASGYIYTLARDDDDEPRLGGGSTHAWCQVYLPGAGWVEFDPTNGIVGDRDLIRIAVARDASQAVPLYGTYYGDARDELGMSVTVDVRKVREDAVAPVRGSDAEAPTPDSVDQS